MEKLWEDKQRMWFGAPLSFTNYSLTNDRIFIESGLINKKYGEIRLYRCFDVTLKCSFIQRIFGLGTIIVNANDADTPRLEIRNIVNSSEVKEIISEQIEKERIRNRTISKDLFNPYNSNDIDMPLVK